MISSRESERKKVLDAVQYSIQRRMDNESVARYVSAAREYGQKYRVEALVEDWLMEGRREFRSMDEAGTWAQTLP